MKTFMKILIYAVCFLSCAVLYYGAKYGKIGHENGTSDNILFYMLPIWGIMFSIVTYYEKLKK